MKSVVSYVILEKKESVLPLYPHPKGEERLVKGEDSYRLLWTGDPDIFVKMYRPLKEGSMSKD